MKKYVQDYKNKNSHLPSIEEICSSLDMRKKKQKDILKYWKKEAVLGMKCMEK